MASMDRRSLLRLMAAAPMAAAFTWSHEEALHASALVKTQAAQGAPFKPAFFTAHEYETVGVLANYIIPKDDRSGSATDAGVPQFMDFMMLDQPNANRQNSMRGGLAWLDLECHRRFDKRFITCADAERRQVLDDISWPQRVKPGMAPGVTFFNSFRDLTASGFWTSEMGINDIQYIGNTFVPKWTGCPPEVLTKLGLTAE
jgi:gluconate 2-dehydrogenase gamma chain